MAQKLTEKFKDALENLPLKPTLKQMQADGVQVNEVDDLADFKDRLAPFKKGYVEDKGGKWQQLYEKIIAVE